MENFRILWNLVNIYVNKIMSLLDIIALIKVHRLEHTIILILDF